LASALKGEVLGPNTAKKVRGRAQSSKTAKRTMLPIGEPSHARDIGGRCLWGGKVEGKWLTCKAQSGGISTFSQGRSLYTSVQGQGTKELAGRIKQVMRGEKGGEISSGRFRARGQISCWVGKPRSLGRRCRGKRKGKGRLTGLSRKSAKCESRRRRTSESFTWSYLTNGFL